MNERTIELRPARRGFLFLGGVALGGLLGFLFGGAVGLFLNTAVDLNSLMILSQGTITPQLSKEPIDVSTAKVMIDPLAATYLESPKNIGLVVGILKNGESAVYGYGSLASDLPAAPGAQTVFEVGPIEKTFIGTILARLVNDGELGLDDPIDKYLSESLVTPRFKGQDITLEHLASHTSALPLRPSNLEDVGQKNPYANYRIELLYEALQENEIEVEPGTQYNYSDFGYAVLTHIIKIETALKFDKLIESIITEPIGLTATRLELTETTASRLAQPHLEGKPIDLRDDPVMIGPGSLLSNAEDLLAYIQAQWVLDEGALPAAMALSRQKQRPTNSPFTSSGLGWLIDSENALDIIHAEGTTEGSSCYLGFVLDARIGVVVLSNSESPVDEIGKKLVYMLYDY